MDFVFDFMQREKIPKIYCLASNMYTRNAVLRLDFRVVEKTSYGDYKVNGKQVYRPGVVHKGWTALIKFVN